MYTGCARLAAIVLFAGCLGALAVPARGLAATPLFCYQTPTPKFIDGRLDDWPEPVLTLNNMNWRPEIASKPVYGGLYDLSANARLAWDDDQLFLAFTVVDDLYLPAKDAPIDTGDAILVRLLPADMPVATPAICTEFCFTFADAQLMQRDATGKWARVGGVKLGTARAVLSIPQGPPAHEEGKPPALRASKCWYELAIPWEYIANITPRENGLMGLEIHIIDVDAPDAGIRGRLKWRGQPGVPRTATDAGRVQFAPPPPARHDH
ncbi:MAG: DOMON domain-containing protein [Armatimonadota bacterium]